MNGAGPAVRRGPQRTSRISQQVSTARIFTRKRASRKGHRRLEYKDVNPGARLGRITRRRAAERSDGRTVAFQVPFVTRVDIEPHEPENARGTVDVSEQLGELCRPVRARRNRCLCDDNRIAGEAAHTGDGAAEYRAERVMWPYQVAVDTDPVHILCAWPPVMRRERPRALPVDGPYPDDVAGADSGESMVDCPPRAYEHRRRRVRVTP